MAIVQALDGERENRHFFREMLFRPGLLKALWNAFVWGEYAFFIGEFGVPTGILALVPRCCDRTFVFPEIRGDFLSAVLFKYVTLLSFP